MFPYKVSYIQNPHVHEHIYESAKKKMLRMMSIMKKVQTESTNI